MTNDPVISIEGRNLLRQESFSFPELLSRCKSLAVWKKKGEKSEETKKQKKGKDFFAADKRGLTQIWGGRKKIKSFPVWENWRKGEWEKMENGWK